MNSRDSRTSAAAAKWIAAAVCCLLAACQSLEQIAPPAAAISARPSPGLELGRRLYVTKCAKCHAPEPVLKYSAAHWDEILADMAEETNLTEQETAAVTEYVAAVLATRPRSTGP